MISQGDATQAASLLRLARDVTARHDLADVLAEVFRCLRPIVEFGGGSIQLLDDEGWIQMAASDPAAPEHVRAQRVPLGSSVAGRVILTEQPVYIPDIAARAVASEDGKRVSTGVRSYLGVPLVADGHAIGLLQVDSPSADAWSEQERSIFLGVAPVVAAAIQNARAHARAAAAAIRSERTEARLGDARQTLALARAAARLGDRSELDRHLGRLDELLNETPEDAPAEAPTVRLPVQRATVPVEPACR